MLEIEIDTQESRSKGPPFSKHPRYQGILKFGASNQGQWRYEVYRNLNFKGVLHYSL